MKLMKCLNAAEGHLPEGPSTLRFLVTSNNALKYTYKNLKNNLYTYLVAPEGLDKHQLFFLFITYWVRQQNPQKITEFLYLT